MGKKSNNLDTIHLAIATFPDDRKDIVVDCDMTDYHLLKSFKTRQSRALYPECNIVLDKISLNMDLIRSGKLNKIQTG